MSRLADDLRKLSQSRGVNKNVIVQDAEELKKEPAARKPVMVYFIGFLIAILVGISAFSVAMSIKTWERLHGLETASASVNSGILSRLENAEGASQFLLDGIKKQQNEIKALGTLVARAREEEAALLDGLKGQVGELKTAVKKNGEKLADLEYDQSGLKADVGRSIEDLKTADKLMVEKHIQLNDKLKEVTDRNAYLYGGY